MTSVICNLCAGHVMGASKIKPSSEQLGSRHAGRVESFEQSLQKGYRGRGRHARLAGRHARPPRAFF